MYMQLKISSITNKNGSCTYKVKGPLTRSKRTLPVLRMISLGISALDRLMTVADRAVESSGKILPAAPKGWQDWQYVAGAQPYKAVKLSSLRSAVIKAVTLCPE